MSNIPSELKYAASHEWVLDEGTGVVTVGITEHAQDLLGDMVFVELPDVGDTVDAGDDVCVAESVKAASDIYAQYRLKNYISDAFGDGWLFKIKMDDASELDALLDAEGYASSIEED